MNSTRVFPLVFLFVAAAFPQTPRVQFSSEIDRANCPIEMNASFRTAGNLVPITPAENGKQSGNKKQLEITFSNPNSEVMSARITIYGFPVGWRVDPAVLYLPHDPAEIKKTIAFDHGVHVGLSTSYEVSLPNFSAVSSINLDSVAYSGGTIWHPAPLRPCQASPLPIDITKTNSR